MSQFGFSSGLELGGSVESSGVLGQAWDAVNSLGRQSHQHDPTRPVSVKFNVVPCPPNITIIAFVASATHEDLVGVGSEMETIGPSTSSIFDFIGTKVNPSFSIHKSALHLFSSIQTHLASVKHQLDSTSPLIITGHSLGGSVASLFTLWLLNNMSLKDTKPPLCITFGSPLLGDNAFQRAIAERPLWNACFLHVVSNQDLTPRLLISSQNLLSNGTTQTSGYKPFGTFLVLSDSGCTCFEDSEAILDVLRTLEVGNNLNQDPSRFSRIIDYGSILETVKNKTIHKGTSRQHNLMNKRNRFGNNSVIDPLHLEIILQLEAVGIKNIKIQQETDAMRSLISLLKERQDISLRLKKNKFDPNKKLNEMKIHMTYLEWYKKVTMDRGGYYDKYKNKNSGTREEVRARGEIVTCQKKLTQYWKRIISEVEKMPVQELVLFRTRWFFAGTNYRRMIEPLDIAEYYMRGNRDYVQSVRSQHYVLLQQWLNDIKFGENPKERNQACSLTEDSCFWAYVEEAIISCKLLKDGKSSVEDKTSAEDNLNIFEHYVMKQINLYAVSPEIFHPESSFMQWWNEYSAMKGPSYNSDLSDFMKNHCHKYT